MIKAVLEAAGHKVGMVGTNGVYYPGHHYDLNNTTPRAMSCKRSCASWRMPGAMPA